MPKTYQEVLADRDHTLAIIKKTKSAFAKKDAYRHLLKLNKEINLYEKRNQTNH